MEEPFNIELAGVVVRIEPIYDAAREFCKQYITDKRPDITISSSVEEIAYERSKDSNKIKIPKDYPNSYLEILALYRKIAECMIEKNILLFHGSGIAVDNNGVLLIADSGVGKSTHAEMWKERFGDRVVVINDDKPLLKVNDHGIELCATPWSGKKGLNTNTSAPLKIIYQICRSDKNEVRDMTFAEKWKILMQQSFKSDIPQNMQKVIKMLDVILDKIPVKKMNCNISTDAAEVAYEGMLAL